MILPESGKYFGKLLTQGVYAALNGNVPITAIGLLEDRRPIGAVAGMIEEGDIFSVLSLYVDPAYRRQGGGRMLIEALQTLLYSRNLPTAILSYIEGEGDSDTISPFMEALGILEDKNSEKLYSGKLTTFIDYGLGEGTIISDDVRSISELDEASVKNFMDFIRLSNAGVKGGGLASFKLDKETSFVTVRNGEISGYLIAGHTKRHPEDMTVQLSPDLSEDELNALLGELILALGERTDSISSVRFPVPDTRYAYLFEEIDGVRDIQHNYLL